MRAGFILSGLLQSAASDLNSQLVATYHYKPASTSNRFMISSKKIFHVVDLATYLGLSTLARCQFNRHGIVQIGSAELEAELGFNEA
eukprot:6202280-Pleurochrysis_carterae.AAC.1